MNSEKVQSKMINLNVCIFGGTTEGRLLAEFLSENIINADLFVATEYGEQFVKNLNHINVHHKRLDEHEMIELFQNNKYDFVADATHPFAKAVSENLSRAATRCGLNYLRVIRESKKTDSCTYFNSIDEIVKYLNDRAASEENILLTTGSKDLDKFANIKNYEKRAYVRILPMEDSLKRALDLGYSNKNIICMQGPFSEELNTAMIKQINAKYVVTKESAGSGGFEEKLRACKALGASCLVIKKPEEKGLTLEEIKSYILKKDNLI